MTRLLALLAGMALVAGGCAGGNRIQERTVRVDYREDEFASYFWRFFPSSVALHPGDAVAFRQEWTGEPHTVTLGRLVDEALPKVDALFEKYEGVETGPPELLEQAEREFAEATRGLPTFDVYSGKVAQNGAQPCFLSEGTPPEDPDTPCPESARRPPAFDGRQSYHSSGFIPFRGPQGNTYRVRLSPDIAPGTYQYFCLLHFPFMRGRIEVRPPGTPIPPQSELNEQARAEIKKLAAPLRRAYRQARSGQARTAGLELPLPVAGYHSGEEYTVAVNEFVPRTLSVRANETITWTIVGAHTISFNVPRYLPIYLVDGGGRVVRNPKIDPPAGGSPRPPPVDFTSGPVEIDGGKWNGEGFFSSGLIGSEPISRYSLRVSRPGRYSFACLIHPPMVGTLIVRR
ncbi:MAG: hypothetical protein ACRDJ4_06425 [Actinomycetota bacterium]